MPSMPTIASRARPGRARQRGQALVFIAVTTAVVLLGLLATFNVGQMTFHRMKLQNTADAAVYSAAVAHARELNFSAYMNRAVIANQVTVAQLVSLAGWARNYENTYNGEFATISQTFANMSSLGAMWTVPFNVNKAASSVAKPVLETAAQVGIPVLDGVITALGTAATAYHYAMGPSIAADLVPGVIKANEPEASMSTLGTAAMAVSLARFTTFTKRVTVTGNDPPDKNRMAFVTQASMDLFYKNRSLPPIWPLPMLIDPTRLFTYGFGPILMMHFHSGGSSLKSGKDTAHLQGFSSLDATGLFVVVSLTLVGPFGIPIPIVFPLPPLPAGTGAAFSGNSQWGNSQALMPFVNSIEHRNGNNTGVEPAAAVQFGAAHINPMTAIPAWIQTGEGPGSAFSSMTGIRAYMEVADNVKNNQAQQATRSGTQNNYNDVAPPWVLEIERPGNKLLTSASGGYKIGGTGTGDLALPLSSGDYYMRSLGRAEAYFRRPSKLFPRGDNRVEWGSTYSPYWQARLVKNGLAEQAASILRNVLF